MWLPSTVTHNTLNLVCTRMTGSTPDSRTQVNCTISLQPDDNKDKAKTKHKQEKLFV